MPVLNSDRLISNRVKAIQRFHEEANIPRAELDVSGGVDSAVMLMLLAAALGPENITAVYSAINSSHESGRRAELVAKAAGVKLARVSATGAYNVLVDSCRHALQSAGYDMAEIDARIDADPSIMGSLRSTLRAPLGRFMNRLTGGGIRHGTGNEDEDRWLRFYQKGGDGEVDTNPLAMLSKGEVYQLAVALKVPREIIEALPTPDLWGTGDQHNDEDELRRLSDGVEWTYSRVDPESGEYTKVGTIERMNRFCDQFSKITCLMPFDSYTDGKPVLHPDTNTLLTKYGLTLEHFMSARKWEQKSRHKENPNCPSLGSRFYLVEDGCITNLLFRNA